MYVAPAVLTVAAVLYFRSIRLGVALLGIAFIGWMLMLSAAVATENAAQGDAPGRCGMLSGMVLLFGWIYGGCAVAVWTAVGLVFRWGLDLAWHLRSRGKPVQPLSN